MRKGLLNGLFAGAIGVLLAYMGFPIITWQYWVVIGLILATIVNTIIDP